MSGKEQFSNTSLNYIGPGAVAPGDTTIPVLGGTWPTYGQFTIRVIYEIMVVTSVAPGISDGSWIFTVLRGQEGTAPATYSEGTIVFEVVTAGSIGRVFGISMNDTFVTTRREINFIEGQGVSFVMTDNPGADRLDLEIDSPTQWDLNSVGVAYEPNFNLIEGQNISIAMTDNPVGNRVDCVISAIINVDVFHNGILVASRPTINFVDSSDAVWTVSDNPNNNRVDVLFSATPTPTPAAAPTVPTPTPTPTPTGTIVVPVSSEWTLAVASDGLDQYGVLGSTYEPQVTFPTGAMAIAAPPLPANRLNLDGTRTFYNLIVPAIWNVSFANYVEMCVYVDINQVPSGAVFGFYISLGVECGIAGLNLDSADVYLFYKGHNNHVGVGRFYPSNSDFALDVSGVFYSEYEVPMTMDKCLWMRIWGSLFQVSPDGVTWTTVFIQDRGVDINLTGSRTINDQNPDGSSVNGTVGLILYNPHGAPGNAYATVTSFHAEYSYADPPALPPPSSPTAPPPPAIPGPTSSPIIPSQWTLTTNITAPVGSGYLTGTVPYGNARVDLTGSTGWDDPLFTYGMDWPDVAVYAPPVGVGNIANITAKIWSTQQLKVGGACVGIMIVSVVVSGNQPYMFFRGMNNQVGIMTIDAGDLSWSIAHPGVRPVTIIHTQTMADLGNALWMRIRSTGGGLPIYYEASPDGVTWTTIYTNSSHSYHMNGNAMVFAYNPPGVSGTLAITVTNFFASNSLGGS